MTATAPVPPDEKNTSMDDAAIMAETRAQKNAEDRVNRESDIETPEEAEKRKRKSLSSFFGTAAAYLMMHNMPGKGKIGKGPNRVIDYGTHVYIPSNPTPEHLMQAAQLAHEKGWGSVTIFHQNGRTINEKASAAMNKVVPNLPLCTDKHQAGSLYKCRLETILNFNAARDAANREAPAPQAMPQPV